MARHKWFDSMVGGIVGFGYATIGAVVIASEAAAPVIKEASVAAGRSTLAGLDVADKHLSVCVEGLVSYLDKHPGLAAVVNPTSVFRRVAYRQTDEAINKSRGELS